MYEVSVVSCSQYPILVPAVRHVRSPGARAAALFFLLVSSSPAFPQPVLTLTDDISLHSLIPYLEVLEDPTRLLTVDEVSSRDAEHRFIPVLRDPLILGYSNSIFWFRLHIQNESSRESDWRLVNMYSFVEEFSVFVFEEDRLTAEYHGGSVVPFHQRAIHHPLDIAPLEIPRGDRQTILLRVASSGSITLPLQIMTVNALDLEDRERFLLFGGFYGVVLIMAFYNLFLYFSVKERSYLFYAVYALSLALYQFTMDGLANQYLFQDFPRFNFRFTAIAVSFIFLAGTNFTRNFLDTPRLTPGMDRVWKMYIAFVFLFFLGSVLAETKYVFPLSGWVGFIYVVLAIVSGVLALRRGAKHATLYLVATSFFYIGTVTRVFRLFGLGEGTFLSYYGMQMGVTIEMTILSLALGRRMNTLIAAQEAEKQRLRLQFARDLHDDVSGTLSSIELFATAVRRSIRRGQNIGKYVGLIQESAREAKERIAEIAWSIDPRVDDWNSFASRLRRQAADLFEGASIEYEVKIGSLPEGNNTPEVRRNLWLMTKEMLTNIVRHSKASKASLELDGNDAELKLRIWDNGNGFHPDGQADGNGIRNILRRAEELSAIATVDSAPGKGTSWTVRLFPLQ